MHDLNTIIANNNKAAIRELKDVASNAKRHAIRAARDGEPEKALAWLDDYIEAFRAIGRINLEQLAPEVSQLDPNVGRRSEQSTGVDRFNQMVKAPADCTCLGSLPYCFACRRDSYTWGRSE